MVSWSSISSFLPLPLHNCNLLRREAVEGIDHFVDLFFEGGRASN
jgi:hypothetical protein